MKKVFTILVLTLFTLPLIHGCSHKNNTSKKIKTEKETSKIETEIYTELKKIDGNFYVKTLGYLSSKDKDNYDKINLLSVKIINNRIKLFYNESLLSKKETPIEDITDPIFSTTYFIARKNKINNPIVKIYVNNKLLGDILEENDK